MQSARFFMIHTDFLKNSILFDHQIINIRYENRNINSENNQLYNIENFNNR